MAWKSTDSWEKGCGKSQQTKLIHTWNNRLFDVIEYRTNSSLWQPKNSKDTLFVALFRAKSESAAGNKNRTWFNFCLSLLRICGNKPGFAVENPQDLVWLDWLSAQPKNWNTPLWRVCQPWIHESECLSTIPFARNTESNTWSTYNTRTSGRGHRPWRCRQRGN